MSTAFKLERVFLLFSLIWIFGCDLSDKPIKTTVLAENGLFSARLSKSYALIGTLEGYAELWTLVPKGLLHKWKHTDSDDGVLAVDIADNEEYAVTAERNSIAWWRISDGVLLSVWSLPDIHSVSLSNDGQFALVGLSDKAIYLSLKQGLTRYAFEHSEPVVATALSISGEFAVTGSEDHSVKLWKLSDGSLEQHWPLDNQVSAVSISDNDKYVATNAALSQTKIWKASNGKLHKNIGPKRITVSSMRFSDNGKYLLTGLISRRIELWSVRSGELLKFWRPKKVDAWRPSAASILSFSFTGRDKKFYSIAANGYLQKWRK